MFAMWAVMMVGMMTPSAAPMILLYARVGRQAATQGKPFAATGWFAGGYLLAWSLCARRHRGAVGARTRRAADPDDGEHSDIFGGVVLVAAGLYQWTPLKDACLSQCQRAAALHPAPWRVSPRRGAVRCGSGAAWRLLRRLLLGADGAAVRRRRHERAVDRRPSDLRARGEGHSGWPADLPYLGCGLYCRRGYGYRQNLALTRTPRYFPPITFGCAICRSVGANGGTRTRNLERHLSPLAKAPARGPQTS